MALAIRRGSPDRRARTASEVSDIGPPRGIRRRAVARRLPGTNAAEAHIELAGTSLDLRADNESPMMPINHFVTTVKQ
jgi:hypothetical protein